MLGSKGACSYRYVVSLSSLRVGNMYMFLMVDQFSKWVEIHAFHISVEQTARCAVDLFV